MTTPNLFGVYPASFPSHSRRPGRDYVRRVDCFASRGHGPGLGRLRVVYTLPGEDITVYSGTPPEGTGLELRPVYAFADTEQPAVPTGRVFVQSDRVGKLADTVAPLGYEVESVPPYAPHAAWLVPADGEIATALRNLKSLMELDGIVSVEPQMLRPAAPRGGPVDPGTSDGQQA